MCHSFIEKALLCDSTLYLWLMEVDRDLARQAKAGNCLWCGGRLDSAVYPRKPRGGPADLADDYSTRLSFCCAQDNCRRRMTPPSVRFLGRKVYLGAVVVLLSAMLHGSTPPRAARLRELFGVSRRTLLHRARSSAGKCSTLAARQDARRHVWQPRRAILPAPSAPKVEEPVPKFTWTFLGLSGTGSCRALLEHYQSLRLHAFSMPSRPQSRPR